MLFVIALILALVSM